MSEPTRDHEAERIVLGSMMASTRILDEITGMLTGPDFDDPRHETIYDAILAARAEHAPTDPVAILDRLGGEVHRVGGAPYLAQIYAAPPTAGNGPWFARIVADKAVCRRLVVAGTRIVQLAQTEGDADVDDLVNAARSEVDAIANARKGEVVMIADSIWETVAALEDETPSTPTPWPDLDFLIGGLRPGALYVIGARPGRGKSVIGAMLALDTARRGKVAAVNSLEMSRRELERRWLAQSGRVSLDRLESPKSMRREDFEAVAEVTKALAALPITVDDRGFQSVANVQHHARSASRKGPLGVVVVDYLQLMQAPAGTSRSQRHEQVAAISRALKILARDMAVPVVALSQLNRTSEARTDKRPAMSDLRESGAVEQDADVVILLHRDVEAAPDILELDVPKNRHGRTGMVRLSWEGQYARAVTQRWSPSAAVAS
jgi:replicative DNA helicase